MLKITTHLCRGSQFSPWKKGNWVCPGTLGREPQQSPPWGTNPPYSVLNLRQVST